MTDFRSIDTSNVRSTAHLAVVTSTDSIEATDTARRFSAAASYDAAVATQSAYSRRVRDAVIQYDSLTEDALRAMVEVSGVSGRAADAAVTAILATPTLLAKADAAFRAAHMSNV